VEGFRHRELGSEIIAALSLREPRLGAQQGTAQADRVVPGKVTGRSALCRVKTVHGVGRRSLATRALLHPSQVKNPERVCVRHVGTVPPPQQPGTLTERSARSRVLHRRQELDMRAADMVGNDEP
jgi:hypothetical protein